MRLTGSAIDVDADPLPDAVLELDHTTDVRRRKFGIYKESEYPEIWVLVPWEASVRTPGPTIPVRWAKGIARSRRAERFRDGRRRDIPRADGVSEVGGCVAGAGAHGAGDGAREGTMPEDDQLMRSISVKLEAKGRR